MNVKYRLKLLASAVALLLSGASYGFQISSDDGSVKGSIDSQITAGFGYRLLNQDCGLLGNPTTNSTCGPNQVNPGVFSSGDNGDLNYNRGDFFALNLKGTNEMLLNFADGYKFMSRFSYLYDFVAPNTERTPLASSAEALVARDLRLLDFWVSKDFNLGGQLARWRFGNQVINWGESIWGVGGINATNALDYQKLAMPGTQIKEAILPAPMFSFSAGIADGVRLESYYQLMWNKNYYPPVGTYFSNSDIFGRGQGQFYTTFDPAGCRGNAACLNNTIPSATGPTYAVGNDIQARVGGEYGLSVHYKPQGSELDTGYYFINYHDKSPVLGLDAMGAYHWKYLENRKLFGVSANLPVGDWALGSELSYRPRDAVATTTCGSTNYVGGGCDLWQDEKHYQWHMTGQLSLTPGNAGSVLDFLGHAQTAVWTSELVVIRFPDVNPGNPGVRPDSGYYTLPANTGLGTANSSAITTDFNWTYDGTLIQGWQVTPGVTYYKALSGVTPTFGANYMSGAQNANFYLLFNQNPVKWQAGLNYTTYFGSGSIYNSPYLDRDFIGGFVTYNF